MSPKPSSPITERQLSLERFIEAAPEKLFRAWTEPDLLKQWFCPKPWTVSGTELELKAGGKCYVIMRSPEGKDTLQKGIYLEVVKNKRLVTTDAFIDAWTPSEKPFMTSIITFDAQGSGTRYIATVLHWTVEDCKKHKEMGFYVGWGKATDQLAELVATL